MTRRSREVGIIKSCVLGGVLVLVLAVPAQADDKKLTFSATAAFTTDYIFRGVSQTNQNPAVQPAFDLTYGIFYVGIWGSNVDFGGAIGPGGNLKDVASVEIDYYAGIRPVWKGITFDIGGIAYTYPGAFDPAGEFDYFELKTGLAYTFAQKLTLGVVNYWSPEYFGEVGDSDAIEGSLAYAFAGKLFNFFSPTLSGSVGYWGFDELATDYTYWNAGLTLGFMQNWSADVRYHDTDLSDGECFAFTAVSRHNCDARVVGTIKAVF
jgi:uncharacterized protein (TIGR02001 family)